MDLISVIVFTYCSQNTVVNTLDSVCALTYPNIELVIADDCSKDQTTEVVDQWLKENKSRFSNVVKVYGKVNKGLPGNLNNGILHSSGKYFKAVAGDDTISPNAIEKYLECIQSEEKVMPVAKVGFIVEGDGDISPIRDYCNRCYEMAQKDQKTQYRRMLYSNWMIAPAGEFYKTEDILAVGGYREIYRWFEDYPMHLMLMRKGYRFKLVDEELVQYRISAGSVSGGHKKELKKSEAKLFFRQKFWYLFENGMGIEAIKQSRYWLKALFE